MNRQGLKQATRPKGSIEYGQYIERLDGPDRNDDACWTPIIYGGCTKAEASAFQVDQIDTGPGGQFRNSRIVRRRVSPWEVAE